MALKVGIVGMRGIGMQHADCHTADELSDLVAVCDLHKDRADEAAEKHKVKAYYTLSDMLDGEPDLDIVDVTTGGLENASWHYEVAVEAVQSGKAVLVEKPLCGDIEEARDLVALASEMDVYLGCNLNHYFTETAAKAREYIDGGFIGEQVYCLHKMGFNGGEATYGGAGSPRFSAYPYSHMKAFMSHPFSVMRHFCGDVTHVQAFLNRPGFRRSAGELMLSIASIHVKFANDAVGYLISQRGDATYGLGGWWSIEVAGTRGTFCIENCIEKISYWPAAGSPAPEKMEMGEAGGPNVMDTGITDFGATFPRRIHAFMEDVTNNVHREDLRGSGRDALAALEYTWAAMESYENGGELVRPNPLPPYHGDPFTVD